MSTSIINELKKINWASLGVCYVILFGSASHGLKNVRDIDLGVKFCNKWSIDSIGKILEEISFATGFSVDRIDVVVLNRDDLSCTLIKEIYSKGVLIYSSSREEYINDLIRWIKICYDYEIMLRKNRVLETALEVLKRKWGLSKSFSVD